MPPVTRITAHCPTSKAAYHSSISNLEPPTPQFGLLFVPKNAIGCRSDTRFYPTNPLPDGLIPPPWIRERIPASRAPYFSCRLSWLSVLPFLAVACPTTVSPSFSLFSRRFSAAYFCPVCHSSMIHYVHVHVYPHSIATTRSIPVVSCVCLFQPFLKTGCAPCAQTCKHVDTGTVASSMHPTWPWQIRSTS